MNNLEPNSSSGPRPRAAERTAASVAPSTDSVWGSFSPSKELRDLFPDGLQGQAFRLFQYALTRLAERTRETGYYSPSVEEEKLLQHEEWVIRSTDPDRRHPVTEQLLRLGLLERSNDTETFHLTTQAAKLSKEVGTITFRQERQANINFLQRAEYRWVHETHAADSLIALNATLFTKSSLFPGEKLARLILEKGGKVAIFHHQHRPLQDGMQPAINFGESKRQATEAEPHTEELVTEFGGSRVVRLVLGTDNPQRLGDVRPQWMRDHLGTLAVATRQLSKESASFHPRALYLPTSQDLLADQEPLAADTPASTSRALRRFTPTVRVTGGYLYPLGENAVAITDAYLDRHSRSDPDPRLEISLAALSQEFGLVGRDQIVVLPHLSPEPPQPGDPEGTELAKEISGEQWRKIGFARHADLSVAQVGETIFVPSVSAAGLAAAHPYLRKQFLERRNQIIETLRENGFNRIENLPRPDSDTGLDGKKGPIHTINFLQLVKEGNWGKQDIIVPWPPETTTVDNSAIKAEIKQKLLAAGAQSVTFFEWTDRSGGIRCLTQHLPEVGVKLLQLSGGMDNRFPFPTTP